MNVHRQTSQQCYEGTIFTTPLQKYIFDEIHGYWYILVDITVITFQLHLTCYWSEKLKDPDECPRRWKVTGSWYKHTIDEYQLPDPLTNTFMQYDSVFFWNTSTNPCIPDKVL